MEDIFYLGIKALVRNVRGEVLLLQVNDKKFHAPTEKSYWDLPGGRVEKGATVQETLRREVEEETGITSIKTAEKLDMVLSNIRVPQGNDGSIGLILAIYVCDVEDIEDITLSDEHVAYAWFAPEQAGELLKVKYPEEFTKKIATL